MKLTATVLVFVILSTFMVVVLKATSIPLCPQVVQCPVTRCKCGDYKNTCGCDQCYKCEGETCSSTIMVDKCEPGTTCVVGIIGPEELEINADGECTETK